ncbi:nitroreductase family protein [Alkalihalobacterium elongatum]|uniref:nitroreductase family protein n=1 Tax=Alkalihalobacterium elongatum TaxID=2675466 RepID=UPI001C200ED7|nr:nitroreductase family protein [Alkalihalobacterium elongatum]
MSFEKSVIETMRKRQSVRTYDSQNIREAHANKINDYLTNVANLLGPFGKRGKIQMVHVTNNVTDKGIKLGTYGFIKNPSAYLVGVSENNKYALVDFGYTFHRLVLYLTEMELGTCWMGGTFHRHSFEKEIAISKGEFIPCVTPIGYEKDKQRMFDKVLRFVVKADNKKPWDRLFFDTSFEKALTKGQAGFLETPIEMVRLGPSASNKQPWRLVLSDNQDICHFYIEHTPNYSTKLGYDMQLLDMGIAMCQFELACKELALQGEWAVEEPMLNLPNENFEYIVSWRSKEI